MTIEQYARAVAEAAILRTTKALGTVWIYPDSTIDAIIASVPAPDVLGTLVKERELLAAEVQKLVDAFVPAPDVQALLSPGEKVELSRLRADYARRGVALEHALKTIDEMRCTCGSGGHPRRCKVHPDGYDRHVAELNRENEIEERIDADDDAEAQAWMNAPMGRPAEPLPAPTGPGFYWARYAGKRWKPCEVFDDEGTLIVYLPGGDMDYGIGDFDAWVGPLVAPTAGGAE